MHPLRASIVFASMALALPACTERSLQVEMHGGIQTKEIKEGVGLPAKKGSGVTVSYRVRKQDGSVIVDTYKQGKTHKFTVGDESVIVGLDLAVVGMKPGGIRHASIPPYSHYGLPGHSDIIGEGETITLEIEMVAVRTSW